ncbi:O-antigen ligase like membrane protein [Spongiibacter sp. IMCC21906]|nr:O-antigen ligase like membrane protein [Spongiibacter sp. IMCC21906]
MVLMILAISTFPSSELKSWIWLPFITLSVLLSLHFLMIYLVAFEYPEVLFGKPMIDGFSHVRSFNHLQVFLIPILFFTCVKFKSKSFFLFLIIFFLLVSQWVLLFYTKGRGVFLALILGYVVSSLFCEKEQKKTSNIVFLISVGVGFLLYWIPFSWVPENILHVDVKDYIDRFDYGSPRRIYLWKVGFEAFSQNPLLGLGGQAFVVADGEATEGSAHNFYINFLAEYGGVAAALLLFLCVRALKSIGLNWRKDSRLLNYIWCFPLFSAVIYSFVTGIMLSPMSSILMALFLGVAIGSMCDQKSTFMNVAAEERSISGLILVVFLAGMFLIGIIFTLADVVYSLKDLSSCIGETICYPRFWLNGNISSF